MVEETPGDVSSPSGAEQPVTAQSIREQVDAVTARFAAASRRTTMVFDPSLAGLAARSVRAGGSLAEFVEAMHQPEDAGPPVADQDALAFDGYEYTACATAQEAEAEMAAWHELLHGRADDDR